MVAWIGKRRRRTSASCRLLSNLDLSLTVIVVFEMSRSWTVKRSSKRPFPGSSSLLSTSFSLPLVLAEAGCGTRSTTRRWGIDGCCGGVIFKTGRLGLDDARAGGGDESWMILEARRDLRGERDGFFRGRRREAFGVASDTSSSSCCVCSTVSTSMFMSTSISESPAASE